MSKVIFAVADLITVLTALAAVLTGNAAIAVLVVLMLAIFILGIVLNRAAVKNVTVEMETAENSNGGEGIAAIVHISNNSAIPVFRGLIRLSAMNTNFGFEAEYKEHFSVRAHETKTVRMYIKSEYCGKYMIRLDDVRCVDMWGLTGVSVCKGETGFACMFPRRYLVGKITEAVKQNYEKERKFAGRKSHILSDILQYREYQKGDSLKNVNWKLSVKHDQLLVREFDTPIDNQMMVILDINAGDAEYQNLTYCVMFSICATYLQYSFSHQICWPDAGQLRSGHIENMDDLLRVMRNVLSAPIDTGISAFSVFENQDRKEKYAKILYVTNGINGAVEHRINTWGNAEIIRVDAQTCSVDNLANELKRLAV